MNVKHTLGILFLDLYYGRQRVLWSDGQWHEGYYFNTPVDPIPTPNLTVADWPHFRQLVDKWVAKGGNSIQLPIFWDWTQIGENQFEFRPYLWALQYAQSKGITIGFFILPFRRDVDPLYSTYKSTTEWSYLGIDREIDSNGLYWGDTFNQSLALGSPKWSNVYKWVDKIAQVIAPYANQVEYVTIGTNNTYETSADMIAINANHPDTVAKWQSWHLNTYGTVAPAMATREDSISVNKIRTAKFISTIYKEINDITLSIIKSRMPNTRYIWHGGSMTDVTYLRGAFTSMAMLPNNYDGVKHNPGGDWDPIFETSAIYKVGKYSVVEWTRTGNLENNPTLFAQNIMKSIDAGASSISYSFFDGLATDTVVESFIDQVITILTQNGYWNKQIVTPSGNSDVINFKTSEVSAISGNKYLDYRTVYTTAFNASKLSHNGNPPAVIWTDDIEIGIPYITPPIIRPNGLTQNNGGTYNFIIDSGQVTLSFIGIKPNSGTINWYERNDSTGVLSPRGTTDTFIVIPTAGFSYVAKFKDANNNYSGTSNIVSFNLITGNPTYASTRFESACSGSKVCQFGYSNSQSVQPTNWEDSDSTKRLLITNGVVSEVTTGGDLYQTKSFVLGIGTWHFWVREKNNNTNFAYLGTKVVS